MTYTFGIPPSLGYHQWWQYRMQDYTPSVWWHELLPGFTTSRFPVKECTLRKYKGGDLYHPNTFRILVEDVRFPSEIRMLRSQPCLAPNDDGKKTLYWFLEPEESTEPFAEHYEAKPYGPLMVIGWRNYTPSETPQGLAHGMTDKVFPAKECVMPDPREKGVFIHPHYFYGVATWRGHPDTFSVMYVRPYICKVGRKTLYGWLDSSGNPLQHPTRTIDLGDREQIVAWRRIETTTKLQRRRAA